MEGEEYDDEENGILLPLIIDDEDSSWALAINRKITLFGTTPIAFTGIILNSIVIWTWAKCSSSFHMHIFLFKSLAVADIVFTSSFCVWYYTTQFSYKMVFHWITFTSRIMVVNFTFILSLYRWTAVKYPLVYQSWSSKFRVRLVLGVIIVYCILLETIETLVRALKVSKYILTITLVTLDQAALTAPLLIQFILSIDIVRKVWRFKLHVGTEPVDQDQRRIKRAASERNRQLTAIIVSIAMVTFLAYPVGNTFVSYFRMAKTPVDGSFKRIVFASANLLYVLQSSINFFIYYWFMPEFRHCLKQMCCSWRSDVYPYVCPTSKPTKSTRFANSDINNTLITVSASVRDVISTVEKKFASTSGLNNLAPKTQSTLVSPGVSVSNSSCDN